jgi:cell division protein FtsB
VSQRPDDAYRPPRGPVSGRAAALGVVLVVLTFSYAYPLRVYLAQEAEIAQLEADQRAQRERIRQLAAEIERWNDDEYIKAQARERLQLVEVGERIYVVGVEPSAPDESGDGSQPAWYEQVWTSVQTADDPPTP